MKNFGYPVAALLPLVRVNAADAMAADMALNNQFAVLQHPVYRTPDSGAAWTGATMNAVSVGVEALSRTISVVRVRQVYAELIRSVADKPASAAGMTVVRVVAS